ncbi:hypothetical protein [Paenibacillus sp. yr247]|uniref:hypothetical protein n=1 Tax=Paenibacillus sp. yr247 TaxID=1761880 RepID=UPI0015879010|nr:hypothetical protein [Paenibacillus sp. yr247]
MIEIDINHVMSQLGIQPIQLQKWQSEQAQEDEVERTCLVDPTIETVANPIHFT